MKGRVPAPPPVGGEATEGWRRGTEGAAVGGLAAAARERRFSMGTLVVCNRRCFPLSINIDLSPRKYHSVNAT